MLKKIAAIIHTQWVAAARDKTTIIGFWAEDNSKYEIKVPEQLRDSIVSMQNWLSVKYQRLNKINREATSLERFFQDDA